MHAMPLVVVATLTAGTVAEAAPSLSGGRLALMRMQNPGYVSPGSAVATLCQISEDKVVIIRNLAGAGTREERAITWQGDVTALIEKADAAPLQDSPSPADMPTTVYSAVLPGNGALRVVELGSTYDGVRRENPAPEARGLRRFIDLHCD